MVTPDADQSLVDQRRRRGSLDVATLVEFVGVFEPLRDVTELRKVRVDAELGTVAWPNGADLDPVVLSTPRPGASRWKRSSLRGPQLAIDLLAVARFFACP
jgi:hypothetical protein